MKVVSSEGLTELIQLSKDTFVDKTNTVQVTTTQLATVATSGNYNDLSNKPTIPTTTSSVTSGSTAALTSGGAYTALQNYQTTANLVTSVSSSSTDSQYPSAKCVYNIVENKADISSVVKKSATAQQTIELSSGGGTTSLGLKSNSTSSYLSFSGTGGWLGSYGVTNNKKPTFYDGSSHMLAYTSDIPTVLSSVSSSSTNTDAVGAKLFYDTVGDIETLINAL